MMTTQNMAAKYTLPILLLTLAIASCNKGTDKPVLNGYKVDGVSYNMDTLERDFASTGGVLKIRSKDNGGGLVYIRRGGVTWPSADGVYEFSIRASATDTAEVKVCFEQDNSSEQYCSTTGPAIYPVLRLTISNGKWAVSLLATQIVDSSTKLLEISASE